MQSKATNIDEYMAELPEERKAAMTKLRAVIKKNIPKGFHEQMSYGMPAQVVPHSLYPPGYHCDPKLPLAFINFASQKKFIVLHHLGLYASKNLLDWFTAEYEKANVGKLDMGKGCVRFKKTENIPYELIGKLVSKLSVEDWIKQYEDAFRKK